MKSCSVMSDSLWPHELYSPWNFPGQYTGVGKPFPSPGDLPNPRVEPRSPTLQADFLPAEAQGKPKNTGVGSLSLLQWIFPTEESNRGLLHCRRILYQLSYEGTSYQILIKVLLTSAAVQETWLWSLGWEDPLEEGMATPSSILAWRIPWMEEPGELQCWGLQRVRHDWVTKHSTHSFGMLQRASEAPQGEKYIYYY